MTATLRPESAAELASLLADCHDRGRRVEIVGGASKIALGRPVRAEARLDLSAFRGIRLYEPEELVLSAMAATPLADIEAALSDRNQMLAFEPPDWSRLTLRREAAQTLGGVVAANLSGPRRFKSGAARDHVLGLEAVNGRGETFKSGGRVVKNVTGYDLPKLLAGSFGTLAAMTRITVKVLPAPEKTRTVLLFGLDDAAALAAMTTALSGGYDVSGAAHLPAPLPASSSVSRVASGASVTALRLEGPARGVSDRAASLRRTLAPLAPDQDEVGSAPSRMFWREIGDVAYFAGQHDRVVWRVQTPPAASVAVADGICRAVGGEVFFDGGGHTLWCAVPAPEAGGADDGGESAVRDAARKAGGQAGLVAASAVLREQMDPFHPLEPAVLALSRRVKQGFDPKSILNPSRLYRDL